MSCSKAIGQTSTLELFEGLPHQSWEGELLKSELANKKTVTIHDFPFYQKPQKISDKDAATLRALCLGKKSFEPFGGYKLCGGFHPDWCLRWTEGTTVTDIHVCFGCHEIKAYSGKTMVYCDMNGDTHKKLKKLLAAYQKERPAKKR